MSGYTKYKERTPEETIFALQGLLHKAGLFPVMEWSPTGLPGLCSNRVHLHPSQGLGQNGKGTDERYAAASGYAELMERLQNGALGQRCLDKAYLEEGGFMEFPDEVKMPISELLAQDNPYMEDIYARLGLRNCFEREMLLSNLAEECYGLKDGTLNVLPYVDIFAGRIVHLPLALVTLFGLTNGMTAGNTMAEAMVQGISELYERYVHMRLIHEPLTPPEIPREELEESGLRQLLEKLEDGGRYSVSVRDCSLGKGYPVSCVIIFDKEKGTFGVKLGSHPSFAISVERTFTESLQGRKLAEFASCCRVGTAGQVKDYHNAVNLGKIGSGVYPASLFSSGPSWQYQPWSQWESSSNSEHLQKLLAHAKAQGYRPLIRDNSHLGFPSFHVVIPGIHDIYPVSMMRVREFWTQLKAARSLDHFPALTEEEEKRLLKYLCFKSGAVESGMGLVLLHDFIGETMRTDRLGAFLALKQGDYPWAQRFFARLEAASTGEKQRYYECYRTLAVQLADGLPLAEAHDLLGTLYDEAVAGRVRDETSDMAGLLTRIFPALHCYDCGKCGLDSEACEYRANREIRSRIKAAIGRSTVSQEVLAAELKQLV